MIAENFEEVGKVVLKNAPKNCKPTAPEIQRQIGNCCAKETTRLIMEDLGGDYFTTLANESSGVYQKEQLAICLRYVDKKGRVVERFLGAAPPPPPTLAGAAEPEVDVRPLRGSG
jgi:hypothetical protein